MMDSENKIQTIDLPDEIKLSDDKQEKNYNKTK